ncbi:MAG: hypothetical protein WBW74_14310, partial [Xanthobacteraceae bacterium]
ERVAADASGFEPGIASALSARPEHEAVASFPIHDSNNAVFLVPAARCCARVLFSSFHPTPIEGRAERRKGAVFRLSRCRARRPRL